MSGICGWYTTDSPVLTPNLIETMARNLCTPATGRASLRATTDYALAAVSSLRANSALYDDNSLSVAYEGTAYFNDIRLADMAATHGVATAIADSYRRRKTAWFSDIHGAFSVAIFDFAARKVLLAVDRLGIRPMCLVHTSSGIVFGATTDCILAHPAVSRQISPQSIFDYLYFHVVPSPLVIYQGMEKLLPGQYALYENDRVQKNFYWQMPYCDDDLSEKDLSGEFRGLLRQTVRRSINYPNLKIGNFLSGGTDSSTLAGVVTEVMGQPAETYSIGFNAQGFDESNYADIAVKHFKTNHHSYYVTPQDVVEAIPLIARYYDEPFGNSSVVPTYYCAKIAGANGINLMIAGDGGDELFGGNVRYAKQKAFELYSRLPVLLRDVCIEPLVLHLGRNISLLSKLQSYVTQAKIPLPDRLESYNLLHRAPPQDILQDSFLQAIDLEEPLENIRDAYHRAHTKSTLHHMLHLDLKNTLADNDLRKVNRACEMAGIMVNYPLLDDAMVEFSGRVPPRLKIKGFTLRYFFKASLKGFLPPEIIKKAKHGFGLPFGLWLNQSAALRELVDDSLLSLRQRRYVNPRYIDSLLNERHSEHATYYGVMIWVLMMLEQWLQQHAHSIPLNRLQPLPPHSNISYPRN